jgi:hypothetical protein
MMVFQTDLHICGQQYEWTQMISGAYDKYNNGEGSILDADKIKRLKDLHFHWTKKEEIQEAVPHTSAPPGTATHFTNNTTPGLPVAKKGEMTQNARVTVPSSPSPPSPFSEITCVVTCFLHAIHRLA